MQLTAWQKNNACMIDDRDPGAGGGTVINLQAGETERGLGCVLLRPGYMAVHV